MTNTYDEYADKAAARYLQGRMDEQAAWVEAVKAERAEHEAASVSAWGKVSEAADAGDPMGQRYLGRARRATSRAAALDALLRRMGVE